MPGVEVQGLPAEVLVRLVVEDIPAQGRSLRADLGTPWARRAASTALEAEPDELQVELEAERLGEMVFVSGTIRASAERECDRCRAAVQLEVDDEVELMFRPEPAPTQGEVELSTGELDVGWYEDGVLDAEAVLSEAIALGLPSRVVCSDPQGCDERTRALLEAAADERAAGHPGLAGLADLLRS